MDGFIQLLAAPTGIPVAGFIGMPARPVGRVFYLRDNCIFQSNLFCTGFIAEILIAAVAVPVFNVALGHMGCRFRFGFHKVCVVRSVYFYVFLAANVADGLSRTGGCPAGMLAFISAFRAYAVLPFVCLFCHDRRIAAVICAGMGSRRLCPYDFAGMIIRIDCSIGVLTDFTDRQCSTSSFAARTVRFVKVGIAAILALMVMLSVFLRPFVYRLVVISVIISVLASTKFADRKL